MTNQTSDDSAHLNAAITFLLKSIEKGGGRASSKAYRAGIGWMPPYRETTGYIIPTLLDAADSIARPELNAIADHMGSWLAEVQEPSGGFVEKDLRQDTKPVVFNTGQILHGFNALIQRCSRNDLIPAARKAGDFLVDSADNSGSFVRNEHFSIAHAYNVRSAWALLTAGRVLNERSFEKVALANADWTVAQQNKNGFFLNNIFQPGRNANTHGIAYVMQGLLEIYCISGREQYLASVQLTANKLVSIYEAEGRVVAEFGDNWEPLAKHLCLTGYAQIAIVLFRLYAIGKAKRYFNTAVALLNDVSATQYIGSVDRPYYGGVKGSLPVYGRYAPLQYPNWATKFFVDALLAKRSAASSEDFDFTTTHFAAG